MIYVKIIILRDNTIRDFKKASTIQTDKTSHIHDGKKSQTQHLPTYPTQRKTPRSICKSTWRDRRPNLSRISHSKQKQFHVRGSFKRSNVKESSKCEGIARGEEGKVNKSLASLDTCRQERKTREIEVKREKE